jgi:hypothetical protein
VIGAVGANSAYSKVGVGTERKPAPTAYCGCHEKHY